MAARSALADLRKSIRIKKTWETVMRYSVKGHELCKIFYRLGYISNYRLQNNNIYILSRFHHNSPILQDIIIYSRPGNRRTVNYKTLKENKISGNSIYYLLSTDYGMITTETALLLKTGGEILCRFI